MAELKKSARHSAALPDGVDISSFAVANKELGLVAYGLSDGSALVLRHVYQVSYPDDVRTITPNILYPFGETPLVIDDDGA
jgi:phosphate transport system permease protein